MYYQGKRARVTEVVLMQLEKFRLNNFTLSIKKVSLHHIRVVYLTALILHIGGRVVRQQSPKLWGTPNVGSNPT